MATRTLQPRPSKPPGIKRAERTETEKARALAFRLTVAPHGGRSIVLQPPGAGSPRACCDGDTLHVRSADSAADLIENLTAGAALAEAADRRDQQSHDHLSLAEYVGRLHRLLEAALPSWHPVVRRFAICLDAYTDDRPSPLAMIHNALAAFDAMPADEKQRIFNGWHVPQDRPTSSEAADGSPDFLTHRILTIRAAGARPGATWNFRNDDDAGVHPVRVLVTEGTSKREVLDALQKTIRLVGEAWDHLVGDIEESLPIIEAEASFAGTFHEQCRDLVELAHASVTKEKSGSSPTPGVPELGGHRNTKARKAMPASSETTR